MTDPIRSNQCHMRPKVSIFAFIQFLPADRTQGTRSASYATPSLPPLCIRRQVWSRRKHSISASTFPRGACHSTACHPSRSISGRRAAACIRNRRSRPDARGRMDRRGSQPLPSHRPQSACYIRGIRRRGACPAGSRVLVQALRVSAARRTP